MLYGYLANNVECKISGTYTKPLNYATNFNVPLLYTLLCVVAV